MQRKNKGQVIGNIIAFALCAVVWTLSLFANIALDTESTFRYVLIYGVSSIMLFCRTYDDIGHWDRDTHALTAKRLLMVFFGISTLAFVTLVMLQQLSFFTKASVLFAFMCVAYLSWGRWRDD